MQRRVKHAALAAAAFSVMSLSILVVSVRADTTVEFQNGVNGYTGEVDHGFNSGGSGAADTTATYHWIDGFSTGTTVSPDVPALFRFDNIIGSGPGQIPAGAYILNATFTLTSDSRNNANSGGPFGVAGLLKPFTDATVYTDYDTSGGMDASFTGGNRGPWFENNQSTRPLAGYGTIAASVDATPGDPTANPPIPPTPAQPAHYDARITPLVQSWVDGSLAQNGMTVQSGFTGTNNAWAIRSAGYGTAADRPKLSVTYTTDPVTVTTIKQGANGYSGTTMAYVKHDATIDTGGVGTAGDTTTDASTLIAQPFLDHGAYDDTARTGSDSAVSIKFDHLFTSTGGSIPDNATIRKAYLVVTTANDADAGTTNARSSGAGWEIDQLANSWDTTTLYNDYASVGDANGQKLGPGTGPADIARDNVTGAITNSQAWFDVTGSLIDFQNGVANNGWAIRGITTDGWSPDYLGASPDTIPQLVVAYSVVPEPASLALLGLAVPVLLRRRRRA